MRAGIIAVLVIIVIAIILLVNSGAISNLISSSSEKNKHGMDEVSKVLGQQNINFAIYPPNRWEMKAGESVSVVAGIKNDAADGNTHQFLVNVIPTAVSSDILRNKCAGSTDIDTCTVSINYQGETLSQFMKSWATLTLNGPFSVEATRTVFNYIAITVPTSAPPGTYMFGVMACKVDGTSITQSQCTPTTTAGVWGGGVQPLEILIKPA